MTFSLKILKSCVLKLGSRAFILFTMNSETFTRRNALKTILVGKGSVDSHTPLFGPGIFGGGCFEPGDWPRQPPYRHGSAVCE